MPARLVELVDGLLAEDDAHRAARYPAVVPVQPVHTVYVPADRCGLDPTASWGAAAVAALDEFGPLPVGDAALEERVRNKLTAEPIEDLRIDFEDGYGVRSDDEEDTAVRAAAAVLAVAPTRFAGIRMKSLEPATRRRALRTLHLLLSELGAAPAGFRVTLPKVTSVAQVEAMTQVLTTIETELGLAPVPFEIQIETPQAILGADGTATVARLLDAAAGRCVGLHYGTYDYSAAVGIAAAYQSMEHPAADHAKSVMQVAVAGTGVPVSDGSTNVLPVGSAAQVRSAWALHARLVRRSLERGFYQGWDLHPAQLPTRFAATFAFYRDGADVALERLRAYLGHAQTGVLDEPATARALAGFLQRGVRCGALDVDDVCAHAGVDAAGLTALADTGYPPP